MAGKQRTAGEGTHRRRLSSIEVFTRCLALAFILQNVNLLYMVSRSPLPTPLLESILTSAKSGNSQRLSPSYQYEQSSNGRFAYVFLMAGCNPKQNERYIGYVYNILISKHVLKQSGSNADVIVLTRMASVTNDETIAEQKLLERAGIIVKYLPKVHTDNFYSAMLDKFQILKLTEYDRVLYMDSDITPFCNLDYMFHMSMGQNPIFAPNVVLSYKHEPAQGGFFMIKPQEGDYEKVQEIIDHRIHNSYNFSDDYGWGHKFQGYPDVWNDMNNKNQTKWDFYGAYADQGLLYHWLKYEKSNVTIIHYDRLETWSEIQSDEKALLGPISVTEVPAPHRKKLIGLIKNESDLIVSCGGSSMKLKRDYHLMSHAPYTDFHHYTGAQKPWLDWQRPHHVEVRLKKMKIKDHSEITDTHFWWYYWLTRVKDELKIDIDIGKFKAQRPLLGLKIPKTYMMDYVDKEREISGNHTGNIDAILPSKSQEKAASAAAGSNDLAVEEQNQSTNNKGRFAYIYLMAGCDPKKKTRYIGYVLNLLISKYILQQSRSEADMMVLVRMTSNTKDETIAEQKLLERAGIIVRYLPKVHTDNFYSAMLDKFQIFKYYSEYERILFMDSDIAPFCNLDYMFHSSIGPDAIFAPNVVLTYKREPAQGGFFMIHPEKGDYEKLQEIIDNRMQKYYNFSEEYGWGHKFQGYPDVWDSMKDKNQTKWDFYGAWADQGLLYHWLKYEKSNVSFVRYSKLTQWAEVNPDDKPLLGPISVTEVPAPHRQKTIGLIKNMSDVVPSCGGLDMKLERDYHITGFAPYSDFQHFTGANKPWLKWKRPANITQQLKTMTDHTQIKDTIVWWFYWLNIVNKEWKLDLDIETFTAERPTLGLQVPKVFMMNYVEKEREISGNRTDIKG